MERRVNSKRRAKVRPRCLRQLFVDVASSFGLWCHASYLPARMTPCGGTWVHSSGSLCGHSPLQPTSQGASLQGTALEGFMRTQHTFVENLTIHWSSRTWPWRWLHLSRGFPNLLPLAPQRSGIALTLHSSRCVVTAWWLVWLSYSFHFCVSTPLAIIPEHKARQVFDQRPTPVDCACATHTETTSDTLIRRTYRTAVTCLRGGSLLPSKSKYTLPSPLPTAPPLKKPPQESKGQLFCHCWGGWAN